MLERIGAVSIILGTVLGVVALGWLVLRLVGMFFTKQPWKKLSRPLMTLAVALLLTGLPIAVNLVLTRFTSLGPLNTIVDGERHLTLTGWDRTDYSILTTFPDTIVLQMANADVTDETLVFISGMPRLRELDVNNSQVTDAGLEKLAQLPVLRDLRLARTKITDDGFRAALLEKESLRNLDLTGTQVASKTVREWKANIPDRKALK